ncbi:hypothetical protein [Candidatus Frankia alpina]|uniref:hypothetical protein n=1 Tax=Candidatus Frankia alpina TaxID=2699483 RepID=UPI001F21FCF8|nr:hypothetical protein [Candidatus Frankia alpina]
MLAVHPGPKIVFDAPAGSTSNIDHEFVAVAGAVVVMVSAWPGAEDAAVLYRPAPVTSVWW